MSERTNIGRRKALQLTGTALITSTIGVTTVAGKSDPEGIRLRSKTPKPLSPKQIRAARRSFVSKYPQFVNDSGAITFKEIQGDDDIYAYNLIPKATGGVQEQLYRIDTPDEAAVRKSDALTKTVDLSASQIRDLHEKADHAFDQQLIKGRSTEPANTGDVSIQSEQPDWSTWNNAGDIYDSHEYPPRGVVIEDYNFKSDPDGGNAMAVQTGVDMEAGQNRFNNGDDNYGPWFNREAWIKHLWQSPMVGEDDMRDRFPRGPFDKGSSSFTVSLGVDGSGNGSVGVSYGYSNPIDTVTDESSQSDNIGRFRMTLGRTSKAYDTNAYFNPGSLALVDGSQCTYTAEAIEIPLDVTWERARPGGTYPETKSLDSSFTTVCDSPT
ncbi:hypothetical protein [Haloferax volcanii]|uniref:Uncharacterized protein n=1 Tax=Haloferax volcanii TaxID=2246 RepID=A0A847TV36_HALVO|nr:MULTISPECIES: hypothetical protein [Haloferax]ELK44569.1 hypothetical protein D320_21690 [Haloferax sp. BAB-2207]NLV02908.1 hypothetical protein [Haloferax alexandrinus]